MSHFRPTSRTASPTGPRTLLARSHPLLWALLVVSAVGNSVLSATSDSTILHIALGLASAACIAALVTLHLRTRR